MYIGVLEKLSYSLRNVEGHTGFALAPEITMTVLSIYFRLTIRLCTSKK